MEYLDTVQNKRQATQENSKQKAFVDSISLVSSDIRDLLASLETSGAKKLDKRVVDAISSLSSIIEALNSVKIENDSEVKDALANIANILGNLDVRPIVNVPKAQVTVNEKEVNFDPLIKALNKPEVKDDDPLVGYKAQDINGDDPHVQYVGFVNAKGNWYIIENSDTTNSLRYVFGKDNYTEAFNNVTKLRYRLFSEAYSEVKA